MKRFERYFRWMVWSLGAIFISGCTADTLPYLFRLGYSQARLLSQRRPIEAYLKDPKAELKPQVRHRLQLVSKVRDFSRRIGLNPGGAYTQYAPVDLRVYVVTAAERTRFRRHEWWWPIVGRLPYKGFFSKERAVGEEIKLHGEHLDTNVRLVRAYSTLGWFDDPVVPGMLGGDLGAFVGILIHESVHATFFRKGFASFNEQAAVLVERKGTERFLKEQFGANSKELRQYRLRLRKGEKFLNILDRLYADLDTAYRKQATESEKLKLRREIFQRYILSHPVLKERLQFDRKLTGLPVELNNAYILSFRLYYKDRDRMRRIFENIGRDLPRMIDLLRRAAEAEGDPFEALEWLSKKERTLLMKTSPLSLRSLSTGQLTSFPLWSTACGTFGSTESNGFGPFEREGSEDLEPSSTSIPALGE